jgi:hypothetical protein
MATQPACHFAPQAGTPFPWRQQEPLLWAPLRAQALQQQQRRWLSGGSVRCAAAAAPQAVAPGAGGRNGAALMRVIDTELRTEAEQSYLAVRSASPFFSCPHCPCQSRLLCPATGASASA